MAGGTKLLDEYRLLIAEVYELAGLSRRISEREAAEQGTSVARWHILSVVSEAPRTVPVIAGRLGQVRQSVQRVVDELIDAGQLRPGPNPAHRRSPLISITPAGAQCLERLWAASEPHRQSMLATSELTAPQLREARATLRRIINSMTR